MDGIDPERLWRHLDECGLEGAAREAFPALGQAALIDRRTALRLMAASAALAAASGCGPGERGALTGRPGGRPSGKTGEVRTTLDQNGLGFGVIVKTVDGNPVKIEGDPDHPASLGRTNAQAQAALLDHYDPERPRHPRIDGARTGWSQVRRSLDGIAANKGRGLHILLQPTASPTLERMIAATSAALPEARFYGYRPIPLAPIATPEAVTADYVLSIDTDFLGPGPMQVALGAAFMQARRRNPAARLVVAESLPSLTGAQADERIVLGAAELRRLTAAIAGAGSDRVATRIAIELQAARSSSILTAPWIGEQRGSGGLFDDRLVAPIEMLGESIVNGEIDTLLILGGNPVHDAPASLALSEQLPRLHRTLYLGEEANETALACDSHVPAPSPLSRWGDLRAYDGSVSLVRPVVTGIGLTAIELLAILAGRAAGAEQLVRETDVSEGKSDRRRVSPLRIETPAAAPAPNSGLTLVFRQDPMLWDGSHASNAWLQELPDPLTGLAWSNAATLAPATADRLGLEDGDEIELAVGGRSLQTPVKRLAGQAPETVSLTLGGGRQAAGAGSGFGIDAYRLWSGDWIVEGVPLTPTGGRHRLIEADRFHASDDVEAVRWTEPGAPPLRDDDEPPSFVEPDYSGEKQWGMVIDLEACIGCNACTIACQAENNIPVVGPEETAAGRAMHWLRVDRYHRGAPNNPETAFQPVPCMHCETAPCEPVCPTAATTHSSEGINQMTYQRCIGTRACSNNCPYKVRRFNWFDYAEDGRGMPEQGQNPRVSIRDRGVMEKCTYCIQRIEAVRVGDEEGPPVTACQQACPTEAISFGDLADPESKVSAARRSPRNYDLLGDLNLGPRTTYLAKVKRDG